MGRRGAGLFSVGTLFASFFGAAMIAAAFAYFNYKFSEYKFINFDQWVFYEATEVFVPQEERYLVVIFTSKTPGSAQKLAAAKTRYPILAIDYYQERFESTENTRFLRGGTNTVLSVIQRFNIYRVPSIFVIKKSKEALYKQDSMIRELDTLEKLSIQSGQL